MDWLYALSLGYGFGSVPFGLILTRAFGAGDLRSIGSGSIGATNVLRTGRKGLAAATLLLDAAKGFLAVWIAWRWLPEVAGFAAIGAIVGHCFPVWLKFNGGKGVATAAGVCAALSWQVLLIGAVIWAAMLAVSKISSVSSLSAMIGTTFAAWWLGKAELVPVFLAIAVIVIVQHRSNISRLIAGTEPRVGS
jgi:acyl phosphate:glycerol-3-phosphate acyltransferase